MPQLETVTEWTAAAVEAVVRSFAESAGVKLGAVAQPLRAALTGKTTSPPIFDVLAVLGRDRKPGAAARSGRADPAMTRNPAVFSENFTLQKRCISLQPCLYSGQAQSLLYLAAHTRMGYPN